ncbi:hypothetical protein BDA96_02G309300 [Sorghum bicolor]|uniref:Uncharacterized protein n=1 Tax=Sorghum bicolor TaxID=4558 RepID=A0A921RS23_SORBI|nr:uncharacterized protein LOC110432771 [Sorghum bicolor]KAG0544820.1 hypothetical protein BDA96_02G309300 [Sorghum bicolor]|eukprot:XP_021309258.1 uncharacterized protein LOC110432771 [Sorghum bicolor]
MAKTPPPTSTSTSTSDPALPTTTTSAPKSSPRPAAAGLLAPLAASARTILASARRSPVTTLAAAFFLLALVIYGEDARTIAELSINDYLYPDADLYNVSGLPPPTCDLSRGLFPFRPRCLLFFLFLPAVHNILSFNRQSKTNIGR